MFLCVYVCGCFSDVEAEMAEMAQEAADMSAVRDLVIHANGMVW